MMFNILKGSRYLFFELIYYWVKIDITVENNMWKKINAGIVYVSKCLIMVQNFDKQLNTLATAMIITERLLMPQRYR